MHVKFVISSSYPTSCAKIINITSLKLFAISHITCITDSNISQTFQQCSVLPDTNADADTDAAATVAAAAAAKKLLIW